MREIKFRAKDWQTNKWVYGFLFMGKGDDNRDYAFILQDKGLKVGVAREDNAIEFPCDEAHLVDKETICQYTGLKDKKGKEIYEWDIIRVEEFWNESGPIEKSEEFYEVFDLEDIKGEKQREYTTPVSWEDGAFVISVNRKGDTDLSALFGDMRLSFPIFIFEVIGNVFDNPELVEG